MKYSQLPFILLVSLMVMGFALPSQAASHKNAEEYSFVFRSTADFRLPANNTKSPRFEFSTRANSYEEAFKIASKACYSHFRSGQTSFSEDDGLSIIDVCANPRGS